METTVGNPKRDSKGRFLKRRSKVRTSRRAARRNEPNPRRRKSRSRVVYRTRYRRRGNEANPRTRRRRARRNPEGINLGRIVSAGLGGTGVRLVMRKVGGLRNAEGKLTGTHYLAAAAAIYVAPNVADWLGASAEEQRAAQDGATGVALAMVADQHADEFSANHLLPFKSPTPTGDTHGMLEGAGMGAGTTAALPISKSDYAGLAQAGRLPAGDVYVRDDIGNVWRVPAGGTAGMLGAGMGAETIDIPDNARPGSVIRNRRTGQRMRVTTTSDGRIAVEPVGGTSGAGMGASAYLSAVS